MKSLARKGVKKFVCDKEETATFPTKPVLSSLRVGGGGLQRHKDQRAPFEEHNTQYNETLSPVVVKYT